MLPAKFGSIWPSSFTGEDFFNINQSETRITKLGRKHLYKVLYKFLHFVPFRQQIWPPRAILVSDWLMLKKSSPLKLLGQMEPNLAGSIYVRSSIKLLHYLVSFGQQTWPLLLKIEHTVKLHIFDGRRMPSDGNTSRDPLSQVS
jgi:hypothetical protein